jgi:hypothetical protein
VVGCDEVHAIDHRQRSRAMAAAIELVVEARESKTT